MLSCQQNIENQSAPVQNFAEISEKAVNLNTATAEEFEKIPNIGEEMAKKIIEHREKYGKFRRVEHLILVRGMSDKKFREMRPFVKAE